MTQNASSTRSTAATLAVFGWVAIGLLLLSVAGSVGLAFQGSVESGAPQLGLALIEALPTLLLVGALVEFVHFFGRVGDGEVFTERNVGTLRTAGEGLLAAAFASGVIVPTLGAWVGPEGSRGIVWEANDLAVGVAAMGCSLLGFALVFRDAVRLKLEHDAIV